MAQKREKDETLELNLPNCCTLVPPGPDPARTLLDLKEPARPRSDSAEEERARVRPGPAHVEERKRPAETSCGGEGGEEGPAKRPVNRCSGCRKRVGLTGFRCRCGDLFCAEHRYTDRHVCTFDYKAAGRAAIARENPVVRAPKILKV